RHRARPRPWAARPGTSLSRDRARVSSHAMASAAAITGTAHTTVTPAPPPLEAPAVGVEQLVEPGLALEHLVEVDEVVVGEVVAFGAGLGQLGRHAPHLQ